MTLWRELVGTISFRVDRDSAFTDLLSAIEALDLQVCEADQHKGFIVVRCLTRLVNLVLWRCWSDKLVFEISTTGGASTTVKVYAIPNLFRTGVGSNEKVFDLARIVDAVKVNALWR